MSAQVRVAVFTDNDFAKTNGVTTTLRAVLRWAPDDLRIRIYTAEDRDVDEPSYLALRSFGIGIPFYREMRMYLPRLGEYVRHARADGVALIHLTTPGPIGLAALYSAKRLRVPMVGSFHTDLAKYTTLLSGSARLGALMGHYLRWPYGRCRRVFVPSQATAATLAAARVAQGRHTLWTRGVDASTFSPGRRLELLREKWRVSESCPALIYVGRLSREKGLADLVDVRDALVSSGLAHRFVFVGDGPMRGELERRLPDAVFVGNVPHHTVAEYLASADLFVFPSRTDTAGNVVLEAQACGLPAVVRPEGGPHENVVDGRSAIVAGGPGDPGFASSVLRLVADHDSRVTMGAAAREYAITRDWPTALAPLFAAYREIANRPSPKAPIHHARFAPVPGR
jgi:glycosyltransferase involved in cell wall biosynthesis